MEVAIAAVFVVVAVISIVACVRALRLVQVSRECWQTMDPTYCRDHDGCNNLSILGLCLFMGLLNVTRWILKPFQT